MKLIYDNCPNCFERLCGQDICPHCGFDLSKIYSNVNTLAPFTILNDRYLLGRVLGQGGFGITYLAKDMRMNGLCAIKEYMPVEYAKRSTNGKDVVTAHENAESIYAHGKERFLDEARTLYSLMDNPTVVKIRDYFAENHTAYLVMEYLDGMNLKALMNSHNGRIDQEQAKVILVTAASALMEIHKQGILHRDISPENIFITKDNKVKLIDFGAARNYVSLQKKDGLSVLLKPGFAPPEQYDRKGEQGPWTDVYALAATFYTAVSGEKLLDSLYRQRGIQQVSLYNLNCNVSLKMSKAIDKAMSLRVRDRYKNFNEFLDNIDITYRVEGEKGADTSGFDMRSRIWYNAASDIHPATQPTEFIPEVAEKAPKHANSESSRKRFWSRSKRKVIPVLIIVSGPRKGQRTIVPTKDFLKVGRSSKSSSLGLDYDCNISREHCLVKYLPEDQQFIVCDVSINGTYLEDGERLVKNREYIINAGDKFYLASKDSLLMVSLEER